MPAFLTPALISACFHIGTLGRGKLVDDLSASQFSGDGGRNLRARAREDMEACKYFPTPHPPSSSWVVTSRRGERGQGNLCQIPRLSPAPPGDSSTVPKSVKFLGLSPSRRVNPTPTFHLTLAQLVVLRRSNASEEG